MLFLKFLASSAASPDAEDEALYLLLDELHHLSLKSSILDKEPVHKVVSLMLEAEAAVEESPTSSGCGSAASALRIINAFDFPKFRYDQINKLFNKDRFLLLLQKLSRDPHFSTSVFDREISDYGSCQISQIQSIVRQTGKRWVMGLISQLEDGHFFLEDLTAAVEVDLSNARVTTGFFSENTVVLAEGEMLLDGITYERRDYKTCRAGKGSGE